MEGEQDPNLNPAKKDGELSFFSRIFDNVGSETFFQERFGLEPIIVRGKPGKFDFLLKPDQFIFGLDKTTEIRCVFSRLRQATIHPADIKDMYDSGASICVTGIDKAHETLAKAANSIAAEIGYAGRVDFRAYLSPPNSGFDIHFDARIATTLQLDGTKTWWYSDQPHVPFPKFNSNKSEMDAHEEIVSKLKMNKIELNPGDLLCLPAGAWHRAKAGESGSLALNMAFNHVGATALDLIISGIRTALDEDDTCRRHIVRGYNMVGTEKSIGHLSDCADLIRGVLDRKGFLIDILQSVSSLDQ